MHQFPDLSWGGRIYRIPLADATASWLARVLLSAPDRRGPDLFAAALLADPAFAVWCCGIAPPALADKPLSVTSLAEWLARQDLGELLSGIQPGQYDLEQVRVLARAGVLGAQDAVSRCADGRQTGLSAPSVLSALVQHADRWLLLATHPPVSPAAAEDKPEATSTGCRAQTSTGAARPGCLDMVMSLHLESCTIELVDPRLNAPLDDSAWDSGQAAGWSESLASLLAKLGRLKTLEGEFAKELEYAKLSAMKELAYGAGHEINNPLANIATRAQTLLRQERDHERRRQLVTINKQAFRAHAMIADMMLYAKPPALVPSTVDIARMLNRLLAELDEDVRERGIRLVPGVPSSPLEIEADENQLLVALRAICQNSIDALHEGGEIRLHVERVRPARGVAHGSEIAIDIADDGPGIPAEIRHSMFDPFFSGREAGRGLGFGLCKAWRIVDEHGGRIEVLGLQESGARFRVILPRQLRRGA